MPKITIELTQAQYDAMSVMMVTPEEWLQHAVEDKARRMMDTLVTDHSNFNPKKLSDQEKAYVLSTIDLAKVKEDRKNNKVNPS